MLDEVAPAILPIGCALIVMASALWLHGTLSTRPAGQCCGSVDVTIPPPPGDRVPHPGNLRPELYARRINYVAALQFQVATIVASLMCGAALIYPRICRREDRARGVFIFIILAVGTFFAATVINEDTSPTLHALIEMTMRHEFASIETMRFAFERTTSVTATLLIAVASLFMLPVSGGRQTRIRELASRHTGLSYLLAVGTTLLAADVLLKMCAGRWAIAYYVKPAQDSLAELVDGIVSGWAVYDSLVLAAAYIPATVVLRGRLQREARRVNVKDPPEWFDPQWLTISPVQEISKILAILAPFLVGQVQDITKLLS